MKFFTRSRILYKVLIAVDFILGIIIAFQIPEIPDAIRLDGSPYDRTLLIFATLCLAFTFVLITIVALKCIVKDAEEDLNAVIRMYEHKSINTDD